MLDVTCFCFPVNIFELCSEMKLSYLEIVLFFLRLVTFKICYTWPEKCLLKTNFLLVRQDSFEYQVLCELQMFSSLTGGNSPYSLSFGGTVYCVPWCFWIVLSLASCSVLTCMCWSLLCCIFQGILCWSPSFLSCSALSLLVSWTSSSRPRESSWLCLDSPLSPTPCGSLGTLLRN